VFFFGWQVPGGMIRPARVRGQYARSAPPLFGFGLASSVGIARDERQGVVRRGAGLPPQSAKRSAGGLKSALGLFFLLDLVVLEAHYA